MVDLPTIADRVLETSPKSSTRISDSLFLIGTMNSSISNIQLCGASRDAFKASLVHNGSSAAASHLLNQILPAVTQQ
jgi:hypothetical protein